MIPEDPLVPVLVVPPAGVVPWETDVPLPVVPSLGVEPGVPVVPVPEVPDVTPLVMLTGVAFDSALEAEAEVPEVPVTSSCTTRSSRWSCLLSSIGCHCRLKIQLHHWQLIPVYHSYQFPKLQMFLHWSCLLEYMPSLASVAVDSPLEAEAEVPEDPVTSLAVDPGIPLVAVPDVTPLIVLPGVAFVPVPVDPTLEVEPEVPVDPLAAVSDVPLLDVVPETPVVKVTVEFAETTLDKDCPRKICLYFSFNL
ncbi:hypothetical protein CEXT_164951 [Caerostris extrusa]|uniref:Uncharacterized protein n=1 Tax=Caerostris extrusa TaxID=172846 RepID=A0AAV4TCE6_CAEEX|nr:hypothetical protein CEXT_164951 [Caerostris extrusa]